MNILVLVCARSGSKRVKNKNIRDLAGKPLISYAINLAKKWGKAKRIICSTDSKIIAKIAKEYGVEVPFIRPEELATDTSGKVDVIRHAFKESQKFFNETYDVIVDLDVSSPLKNVEDLNNCLKIYKERSPEILFSVTKARRNPYFNMVELDNQGRVKLSKELEKSVLRSQDAPKVYDMNASIYFYSKEFLLDVNKKHPLSTEKAAIYVMGELASVDIDSELDFKYIEFLIKEEVIKLD